MSRFDEFRESLQEANNHLTEAVNLLGNTDDFDSEGDRYDTADDMLSDARSSLWDALDDISDNVGIQCDDVMLRTVTNQVEILKIRVQADAIGHFDGEEYDYHKCRGYIQSIRDLQSDIDRIARDAR